MKRSPLQPCSSGGSQYAFAASARYYGLTGGYEAGGTEHH